MSDTLETTKPGLKIASTVYPDKEYDYNEISQHINKQLTVKTKQHEQRD